MFSYDKFVQYTKKACNVYVKKSSQLVFKNKKLNKQKSKKEIDFLKMKKYTVNYNRKIKYKEKTQ